MELKKYYKDSIAISKNGVEFPIKLYKGYIGMQTHETTEMIESGFIYAYYNNHEILFYNNRFVINDLDIEVTIPEYEKV